MLIYKPYPIGIFDSGVGGLSVLRAIRVQLPLAPIIYLGDQAHVPYGVRSVKQIQTYSKEITRFFISKGARLIVVACNTASAAALGHLRETFPEINFVGMEPAVKPAAEQTHSRVVGVLATPATFDGPLYSSVVARYARGVVVLQDTCEGLVFQIEKGELDGGVTEEILRKGLLPMLEKGIDTLVLGCTHYPFVIQLIRKIIGPDIKIIDPAPAVARQVQRMRTPDTTSSDEIKKNGTIYYTTAASAPMETVLPILLGENGKVRELKWQNDVIYE